MMVTSQRETVTVLPTGEQEPKRENNYSSCQVTGSTLLAFIKLLNPASINRLRCSLERIKFSHIKRES